MTDHGDFITLLTTINLAVLAAAITLLALYPAIVSVLSHGTAAEGNAQERFRKSLFNWLGVCAATAWIGVLLLLGRATMDILWPGTGAADPSKTWNWEDYIFLLGFVATAISLIAAAGAGIKIFIAARDAA